MSFVFPRPRGGALAPALALALWLLFSIGLRPLALPDEGRYAGVALEMLHGDALQPTLDGLPFFHKPPLLYWLDLLPLRLLGANGFAARCGPALLGWLLGMALFLHLRRRHGEAVARTGLLVLATSPLFFIGAQYVNHDVGVAACITAALLATLRAVEDPRRVALRWLMLGWLFCGLGVLAKGLIGIVLPAAVIGPWLLAQGRWRQVLGLLHPAALLVFAAVTLPWMAAMQLRHPAFFDYFIVEQHFRRFTGTNFNNRMPFWFFVVVLPLLMLPWTLWLAPALRRLRPVDPQTAFYAWWIVVIVGFFSLPESKLVGYVMPALAPTAALLALALQQRSRATTRAGWIAAAFCVAIVGVFAWKSPGSHRELARALAAGRAAGDRVVFVDDYFYDVPFYADLAAPVIVVSAWDDPDIARHDNWRKELADAARFTSDQGRSTLWTWDRVADLDCAPGRVWLLAPADQVARLAALPGLKSLRSERGVELLVAPGRACGAPS
ncbi:MAG: glycosyltransferase family 39 protein [Burkholderiales bacterium]|nr:glycosyltransferase family 39 protein [Burkholderiales bacterium]